MKEFADNNSEGVDPDALRGHVALKGFFNICTEWRCSSEEAALLLGGVSVETLSRYQTLPHQKLERETLKRISYVLGIYKALRTLYPTAERANHRIRLPTDDSPFNGQSALEYMSEGSLERLRQARQYFEALKTL
ncbi:antitoxin Xre-like helix-turn-helix domain-containing protein [Marinobacter salsuginis]|uniref:antitoxin Xre-like helix-turn-helix domain-containing protein n=1 Tax=Marinobacter salsuginis TaxID=418719 RepID=UPI00273D3E4D|nr:antitoxin Xre-like helix-turn-helix domain-containing protein [Marinobacter salsuginis]